MKRLYKFLFSLYPLSLIYNRDEGARVVYIRKNKPTSGMSGEEVQKVEAMMAHFSKLDYFVIVKGR